MAIGKIKCEFENDFVESDYIGDGKFKVEFEDLEIKFDAATFEKLAKAVRETYLEIFSVG